MVVTAVRNCTNDARACSRAKALTVHRLGVRQTFPDVFETEAFCDQLRLLQEIIAGAKGVRATQSVGCDLAALRKRLCSLKPFNLMSPSHRIS